MESHDAHILRNDGVLSGHRREEREYWENTRTKRKGRQEGDARCRRREDEARGGEGDAARLINRHADNHSGFMVTTDYQVVQGGIFHIRDVTLFQWGNTCSARYKLHERAHTARHVCCSPRRHSSVYVCIYPRARTSLSWLEEASRCPVLPVPSLPLPLFRRSRLKIIPTFSDYKNARPLFRESDPLTDHRRHSTPTRYPFSRLERGLLTGAKTSLGVARQSWNFETTRPKGWNCNPR